MVLFPQFFQYLSLVASSLSLFIVTKVLSLNTLLEVFIVILPFKTISVKLGQLTKAPSSITVTFGITTLCKLGLSEKAPAFIVVASGKSTVSKVLLFAKALSPIVVAFGNAMF